MNHDQQTPVTNSSGVGKPQSAAQKYETPPTSRTTDGSTITRSGGVDCWVC